MYQEERELILRAVGSRFIAIEHVGSTSVSGLSAKPVIDILAGVTELEDAEACIGALEGIGYEYVPEYEVEIPERRYFRKGPSERRTHHLHVVEMAGGFWEETLLFRDYLREHSQTAKEYAALKRRLADTHAHDRAAYTEAKAPFIQAVLGQAMASGLASPEV